MRIDLRGQREAMALASIKLETGNTKGAIETLNGAIAYRNAQREPRERTP